MTKKTRRKFTDQEKEKAVAEYLGGAKSAKNIAQELGVPKEVAERLLRQQEEITALSSLS